MSSGNNRLGKPLYVNDLKSWQSKEAYLAEPGPYDALPKDVDPSQLAMVVMLNWQSTTEDLRNYIRKNGRSVNRTKKGLLGWFPGWENDPREVHQIPEIISLCKRIIESGLIGLMNDGLNEDDTKGLMAIGAAQVWAIANGKAMKKEEGNAYDIDPFALKACLEAANEKVDSLLADKPKKSSNAPTGEPAFHFGKRKRGLAI